MLPRRQEIPGRARRDVHGCRQDRAVVEVRRPFAVRRPDARCGLTIALREETADIVGWRLPVMDPRSPGRMGSFWALVGLVTTAAVADDPPPLERIQTIGLKGPAGGIDHLA